MTDDFCAAPATPGLAARLLAETDCQAFGLVERGYAALAQPGGPVATALTGLLVLAVALFGYRLLLGRGLLLTDAVSLAIKIGIVLLIATSWDNWQTLAYDSFARAPVRLAGELLTGAGARDPMVSLQPILDNLELASAAYRTRAGIASPLIGGPAQAAMTLNLAGLLIILTTVGVLVAARVVLAILLAIAPAMAGFILFDPTRGMAEGWLGAMIGAALAPLFVLVLAAIELAILGPLVVQVLAEQAAGRFDPASVTPLGLVTVVFAIAMIAALRAGARIGRGLRLPRARATAPAAATVTVTNSMSGGPGSEPLPAAAQIAQALTNMSRRDGVASATGPRQIAAALASNTSRDVRTAAAAVGSSTPIAPLRRPALPPARRRSRAAARRDG